MDRREHWNKVYVEHTPDDVSWFQVRPALSLELIEACGVPKDAPILDVGAGAANLVDCLLDLGYSRVGVLDISGQALEVARNRLGERAKTVEWFEADVTAFQPPHRFALWHDRAAFHFLTDPADQARYVETLRAAIEPGGHVIIGTFALDGPAQCSGLDVARYDARGIGTVLGPGFELAEQRDEVHRTPWGSEQRFSFFKFEAHGGLG